MGSILNRVFPEIVVNPFIENKSITDMEIGSVTVVLNPFISNMIEQL